MSALAVLLIPVIISGAFLAAAWNASPRLKAAEAVVVNLDHPVRVDSTDIALGNELALFLLDYSSPTLEWSYGESLIDARSGLASGRYAAVVVIPADFSSIVTGGGTGGGTGDAVIDIQLSPLTGVNQRQIATALADAAGESVAGTVGQKALRSVSVTLDEVDSELATTTTEAKQAASSAVRLSQLADTASQQSGKVSDTTSQVAGGSREVYQQADDASQQASAVQEANRAAAEQSDGSKEQALANERRTETLKVNAAEVPAAIGAAQEKQETASESADSARSSAAAVAAAGTKIKADAIAVDKATSGYLSLVDQAVNNQQDLSTSITKALNDTKTFVSDVNTVTTAVEKVVDPLGADDKSGRAPQQPQLQRPELGPTIEVADQLAKQLEQTTKQLAADQKQMVSQVASLQEVSSTNASNMSKVCESYDAKIRALNDGSISYPKDFTDAERSAYRQGALDIFNDDQVADGFHEHLTATAQSTTRVDKAAQQLIVPAVPKELADGGLQEQLRVAIEQLKDAAVVKQDLTTGRASAQPPLALASESVRSSVDNLTRTGPLLTSSLQELSTSQQENSSVLNLLAPGGDTAQAMDSQVEQLTASTAAQQKLIDQFTGQLDGVTSNLDDLGGELSPAGQQASLVSSQSSGVNDAATELSNELTKLGEAVGSTDQAAARSVETAQQVEEQSGELAKSANAAAGAAVELGQTVQEVQSQSSTVVTKSGSISQRTASTSSKVTKTTTNPVVDPQEAASIGTETTTLTSAQHLPWATLLVVLSAWFGALAMHLVFQAIPIWARSSSLPAARLVVRVLAPGWLVAVVHALLLGIVAAAVMRLDALTGFAVAGILLIAGAAFMAVNHALHALFGRAGTALSVGLALLTALGEVTTVLPVVYDQLRQLSPLTPALDAIRTTITGGSGTSMDIGTLIIGLVVGLVFGAVALLRTRMAPATVIDTSAPAQL